MRAFQLRTTLLLPDVGDPPISDVALFHYLLGVLREHLKYEVPAISFQEIDAQTIIHAKRVTAFDPKQDGYRVALYDMPDLTNPSDLYINARELHEYYEDPQIVSLTTEGLRILAWTLDKQEDDRD